MIFTPGQPVTIRTAECLRHFSVVESFEPFTFSVVLLVRDLNSEPSSPPVVLKIFDTRYLKDRAAGPEDCPHLAHRPWSAESERAAAQTRAAFARGELAEDPYQDGGEIYDDWPPADDLPAQAHRRALWEEFFYRHLMDSYTHERKAYDLMRDLQGTLIPRFLGEGTFVAPPSDDRSIEPATIILEYIPGVTLDKAPAHLLTPALYVPFMEMVDNLHAYGLAHGDLHANNVILSPADNPTRMVIIDWGESPLRLEDQDDEEWMLLWRDNLETGRIRNMLKRKGVVVDAPMQFKGDFDEH